MVESAPRDSQGRPQPRGPGARWAAAPLVVLAIALLTTSAMALLVWNNTAQKDRDRFHNLLERSQSQIHQRLEMYLAMLRAGRGLFAATPEVSRQQFQDFVEQFQVTQRYPGIQGIGFTRRVLASEKDAFIAQMRAPISEGGGGFEQFRIWPEHERDEYHSIIYLEPLDRRNQAAIGYDMFTEANRNEAMARARDMATAAASGKVTLVQEIDEVKQAGFLIYVPVYRSKEPPPTVEQRREELVGFVYSPFRAEDLFAGVFAGETRPRIEFEVYDGPSTSPEALLRPGGPEYDPATASFTAVQTIDVAGRPWTIAFATRPEFDVASSRWYAWIVLLAGVIVSTVLFLITQWQVRSARLAAEQRARHELEISRALDQRSFELTQIHEQLRRSESMAMLGQLSAGIAHDLGNLVLPLRTRLDLLQSSGLDDRQLKLVEAVARNVGYVNDLALRLRQSMKRTVDQSTSVAETTSNDGNGSTRLVELDTWCRDNEQFLRNVVTPPRTMICHVPAGLPAVKVDPVGLAQAMYNLVQNAEKAMRQSGVGRTITVTAQQDDQHVALIVKDDGPGLSPHAWQRCVDLGFMTDRNAPDARRTSALLGHTDSSSGLGLSLVKTFVESSGGKIIVTSAAADGGANQFLTRGDGETDHASTPGGETGCGTEIIIRLPLAHNAAARVETHIPAPSLRTLTELRIACVDDFSDLLNLVNQLIDREMGMRCVATFNEAGPLIEWLSTSDPEQRPDVIVMDWAMPGLSAAKAIEHITLNWPEVRVYIFTSRPRHLIGEEAIRAGAAGIVEKSEGVHTLLRQIQAGYDLAKPPPLAARR